MSEQQEPAAQQAEGGQGEGGEPQEGKPRKRGEDKDVLETLRQLKEEDAENNEDETIDSQPWVLAYENYKNEEQQQIKNCWVS